MIMAMNQQLSCLINPDIHGTKIQTKTQFDQAVLDQNMEVFRLIDLQPSPLRFYLF